jgi:hypothetical protein
LRSAFGSGSLLSSADGVDELVDGLVELVPDIVGLVESVPDTVGLAVVPDIDPLVELEDGFGSEVMSVFVPRTVD